MEWGNGPTIVASMALSIIIDRWNLEPSPNPKHTRVSQSHDVATHPISTEREGE